MNLRPTLVRLAVVVLAWLGLAAAAAAQYSAVYRPTTPFGANYTSTLRSMATLNAYNAIKRASTATSSTATVSTAPAPQAAVAALSQTSAPRHDVARTDFRPSGPRDTIASLASSSAYAGAEREKLVVALKQIQSLIEKEPGFRRNNLANATALLIGASLRTVSGQEISEAAVDNLIRILNDDLIEQGIFGRMTDADRTRAYDVFIITGGLIGSMDEAARERGDKAMASQAKEMATQALRSFGLW